jgi:hypothetical protein
MISYSTNFMGPMSLQWYRDRGIPFVNKHTPATMYAGGRIDVYGLSEYDYYEGKTAIGLPIMSVSSFNTFSTFLQGLKTHKLLSYDQLVELYYLAGNPIIDYAPQLTTS